MTHILTREYMEGEQRAALRDHPCSAQNQLRVLIEHPDTHEQTRSICLTAIARLDRLEIENAALLAAAERVCWFDWSGNDDDAVKSVQVLRALCAVPSESKS